MDGQFNPDNMTYSGLLRFAKLVDMAMDADMIDPKQRMKLIGNHAYDYANPDAIKNMEQGIKAAQEVDREWIADPRTGGCRVVY